MSDLEEYVQNELSKMLGKRYLEEITGPLVFGEGNFEVFFVEPANQWDIKPNENYNPAVPMGILDFFEKEDDHEPDLRAHRRQL